MTTGRGPHPRRKKRQTHKRSHRGNGALEKDPGPDLSQTMAKCRSEVSPYQKMQLQWSLRAQTAQMEKTSRDWHPLGLGSKAIL